MPDTLPIALVTAVVGALISTIVYLYRSQASLERDRLADCHRQISDVTADRNFYRERTYTLATQVSRSLTVGREAVKELTDAHA